MTESAAGLPVVREVKDGDRKGLPTQDELGAGEERDLPVILS
jgi:hypothetical protein